MGGVSVNAAVLAATGWAAGLAVGVSGAAGGAGRATTTLVFLLGAVGAALLWRAERRPGGRLSGPDRGRWWAGVTLMAAAAGAGYGDLRGGALPVPEIERPPGVHPDAPRLVQVTGTVATRPRLTRPREGPFADFAFGSPVTRFELKDLTLSDGRRRAVVPGRLLVRLGEADATLRHGEVITARGWWSKLTPPDNPGAFDFAGLARERGWVGRLRIPRRANVVARTLPPATGAAPALRSLRDAARRAVTRGWPADASSESRTLAELLLLGRTEGETETLRTGFREAGLSHLLSISGAHVGVLLVLVWWVARGLAPHPRWAGAMVVLALGFYLLLVPPRVPILRAGLMAVLFAAGSSTSRRLSAGTLWAAALLVTLLIWPRDVFAPGLQLSFAAVGALVAFAGPLGRRWAGPGPGDPGFGLDERLAGRAGRAQRGLRRAVAAAGAVGLVAWAASLPLLAVHFGVINPWAVLTSVLAVPVLFVTLLVGFVKLGLGLLLPGWDAVLAWPLARLTGAAAAAVRGTAGWPGASVWLSGPAPAWLGGLGLAGVAAGLAFLAGRRGARRVAVGVAAVVLGVGAGGGLVLREAGAWGGRPPGGPAAVADPVAVLSAVSVRDGSCFVLQSRAGGRARTLVFDCGSQQLSDVGEALATPALRWLGVRRIDVLLVSHADLDHYNGVPDLLQRFTVGEVWLSPDVTRDAAAHPGRGASVLLAAIDAAGVPRRTVTRGHRAGLGRVALQVLWPPAGGAGDRGGEMYEGNEGSVVLRADTAGRRLLLSGDVQERAIDVLLERPDALRADVADLPHHGAVVRNSDDWLAAVDPRVVLHSSGYRRFDDPDKWRPLLGRQASAAGHPLVRAGTSRDGFVQVRVGSDGTLETWGYRSAARPPERIRPADETDETDAAERPAGR